MLLPVLIASLLIGGCMTISKDVYKGGLRWDTVPASGFIDANVRVETECFFTPEYTQLWYNWGNTEENLTNYKTAACERIMEDMLRSRVFSRANLGGMAYDAIVKIDYTESQIESSLAVSVVDPSTRKTYSTYNASAPVGSFSYRNVSSAISRGLSDIRNQMLADYHAGKGIKGLLASKYGGQALQDSDTEAKGPWLGIQIQAVTPELSSQFGIQGTKGALVTDVMKGSPAEKAGIKPGDIILELNRKAISAPEEVRNAVSTAAHGESMLMRIHRDRTTVYISAKVESRGPQPIKEARKEQPYIPESISEKLPPLRKDTYAVVIGIDYKNRQDIPNLQYASQDATRIHDTLTDPRYGGVPKENAALLLNEKATRNEIVAALRKIKTWDGYVYVYYSGHGAPKTKGEKFIDAYLVPQDAVITDPETIEDTSIKVSYLQELVDTSNAKGVMVALDACFSGGGKSIVPKGGKPLVGMMVSPEIIKPKGVGKMIITSSATNEQSWEDDKELKSGIFSHYLLEGMKGGAGKDVWVKVDELAEYIKDNVARAARKLKGIDQTPQITGRADFAVTRNWEKAKVMDIEIARGKIKSAFEKGSITAEQLNKALDELKTQKRSKTLDAFLEGKIDDRKFGELY
jgi:hypothetical protein